MAKTTLTTYTCDACESPIEDVSKVRCLSLSLGVVVPPLSTPYTRSVWSGDLCPTCFLAWETRQNAAVAVLDGNAAD